jgi:hypothetical protein
MEMSYEELERLVLGLDIRDRRRLLDVLLEGLADDEAPLHRVDPLEILERIRQLESGEVELLDADEVIADAWRRLAR